MQSLINANQVLASNNLAQFSFLNLLQQNSNKEQELAHDSSRVESSKLKLLLSTNNESNTNNPSSKRNISQVLSDSRDFSDCNKQLKRDESTN